MDASSQVTERRNSRQKKGAESTRRAILKAAYKEFARGGYSGARIEKIAKLAKCNIRMLYHHFGSKEQLYVAVLESVYEDIRNQEAALNLEERDPLEGILRLFELTFHHFESNPQFISLLGSENLMRGRFVLKSKKVTVTASPLLHAIQSLLAKGQEAGVFRKDIDPVQLYVTIAALSWFHLSNAYTLSAMFGEDLTRKEYREQRLVHSREVLKSYLTLV